MGPASTRSPTHLLRTLFLPRFPTRAPSPPARSTRTPQAISGPTLPCTEAPAPASLPAPAPAPAAPRPRARATHGRGRTLQLVARTRPPRAKPAARNRCGGCRDPDCQTQRSLSIASRRPVAPPRPGRASQIRLELPGPALARRRPAAGRPLPITAALSPCRQFASGLPSAALRPTHQGYSVLSQPPVRSAPQTAGP